MKSFFSGVVATLGSAVVISVGSIVIVFYLIAFEDGAKLWFSWEGWWVIAIFLIAFVLFPVPVIGPFFTGVVG